MSLVQILECNDTLGTCCTDYGLVLGLDALRKALDLIQLIAPIVLIVWSCVELVKLMNNPDDKKGFKPLVYKYLAAVICFMVPVLVDAILGLMPETFSLSSCWEEARVSSEIVRSFENSYISPDDQTMSPVVTNPDDYEKGNKRKEPTPKGSGGTSTNTGYGSGSVTGKAIVQYARQFVGQPYVWSGTWNGELPYTGTDCSGFVQGVFRHHGINLPRDTASQWAAKSTYTLVNGEIMAGDLIMYNGHVGILTGNGTEVIHAKGTKFGVVADPDYRTCSSKAIFGIMRINGVN